MPETRRYARLYMVSVVDNGGEVPGRHVSTWFYR
jgi:hypothetical protein